jgi:hypothetical protein
VGPRVGKDRDRILKKFESSWLYQAKQIGANRDIDLQTDIHVGHLIT